MVMLLRIYYVSSTVVGPGNISIGYKALVLKRLTFYLRGQT